MATMEYSPDMMNGIVNFLFNPIDFPCVYSDSYTPTTGVAGPFYANISSGDVNGICIMQGTVPADFSTLTSVSARSADILMYFDAQVDFGSPGYTNNRFTLSTPLKAATASGTATWFWSACAGLGATNATTITQQFFGTVGLGGSGADLTITDTAIVSGELYRIASLIIEVPSTYTV